MGKFTVEITETLQKQIEIEATSATEAKIKIITLYKQGDIVLSADDHTGTDIDVIECIEPKRLKSGIKGPER